MQHALVAGDPELAAHFIAQGLCDVLNREDRSTLERWLGLFTDKFVRDRPDLLIVRGFSLYLSGQLDALAKTLPRAAALLEGASNARLSAVEREVLRGCLAAFSAVVAYYDGDMGGAVLYSREALALLPETWSFVRSGELLFQALAMQAAGQGQAAIRLLSEEYEGLGDRANQYALRLLLALCFVNYMRAEDLERVIQTARR